MAKGNNGNVLQHGLLCELARRIADPERKLYLVDTHAMAPKERLEKPKRDMHSHRARFVQAERLVRGDAVAREPAYISAWRNSRLGQGLYPNTIALLRAMEIDLQGIACESDPENAKQLFDFLKIPLRNNLLVHQGPWQEAFKQSRTREWLFARNNAEVWMRAPDCDRPWLVTMDPYCYRRRGASEAQVDEKDLALVVAVLRELIATGHPGCLALFTYGQLVDDGDVVADTRNATTTLGMEVLEVRGTYDDRAAVAYTPTLRDAAQRTLTSFATFFGGL